MATGARRAELCALHVSDIDLGAGVIFLHRALYMSDDRSWHEKDTKAYQHRRIALDLETVQVIQDQGRPAPCERQSALAPAR